MKPANAKVANPKLFDVAQFLNCPNCHRSGTVELSHHIDGDFSIECVACGANAFGNKLHESTRKHR